MVGIIDGKKRRTRPSREWVDDITEWCQKDIYQVYKMAKGRKKGQWLVYSALDTYGRETHGLSMEE